VERLPGYGFCHGAFFVGACNGSFFFSEERRRGLLAVVPPGATETRFARLTAIATGVPQGALTGERGQA
jgi:hypothetical protein